MLATEMKAKAIQRNQEITTEELRILKKKIGNAVGNGKFSCTIERLSDDAKSQLTILGYDIEYKRCGIQDFEYVVSWG